MSRRRMAHVIAASVAAAVLLVGLILASLDREALARRVLDHALPRVSETLGREVTVEGADARLLGGPRVTLRGLVVAGRPGEPALVEAEEVEAHLRLWPLIRSLGRDVRIDAITLRRPELHLVRDRRETWNYEGLAPGASEREVTIGALTVEDATVHVIDRSGAGEDSTVALTNVDVALSNLSPGAPANLRASAAFAGEAKNLEVNATIDPLPASMEDMKTRGFPALRGTISLAGAELNRLAGVLPSGLGAVVRGGRADLDGDLHTADDGRYVVDGKARLQGVRMRGEPASGSARFSAGAKPDDLAAFRADLSDLALHGPGLDLAGSATFTAKPRNLTFALAGKRLDLDVLLAEQDREPAEAPAPVLPAGARRSLDAIAATGTLRLESVVRGKLELRDLDARARLERGTLSLEKAEASLHGGRVVATGTTVNLLPAAPTWSLRARLEQVDAASMMLRIAGDAPLQGKLNVALDVSGAGASWPQIQGSVSGTGAITLRDGALTSADIGGQVLSVTAAALRLAGKRSAAQTAERAAGQTELRDTTLSFRVKGGWLELRAPLAFDSPFGGGTLGGRVSLDRRLDLSGSVILTPDVVSTVTGFRPPAPLELPLRVGGTLSRPELGLPPPEQIARSFVESAAREGLKKLEQDVKSRARKQLQELLR